MLSKPVAGFEAGLLAAAADHAPMPEETASPQRTPDSPPPLIFDWKRVRGVKRRLAAFLIVAAAGHAALFYLFRVVPAVSNQKPPQQQAVVYLPASEPSVRSMLSALNDRYPGSVVRSEDYTFQADLAALASVIPKPAPVWSGPRAALKNFTQPLAPQEMPRLMPPGDPFLPESSPPPPLIPAPVAQTGSAFSLTCDDSRAIAVPALWPENFPGETFSTRSVTFMVALDRHGRPEHCMAMSAGSNDALESLRSSLMAMRWEARPEAVQQWVTVHVRW